MKLLGVCGSLQVGSSNAAVLRAVAGRLPAAVDWDVFGSTGDLPAFNPDIPDADAPPSVQRWRSALRRSDGVVISTPEYAHSLPGALKNALDWVVGTGELVDMPVLVISAGPSGGSRAMASLTQVLRAVSADVVAGIEIAAVRQKLDGDRISDAELRSRVDAAVASLLGTIGSRAPA